MINKENKIRLAITLPKSSKKILDKLQEITGESFSKIITCCIDTFAIAYAQSLQQQADNKNNTENEKEL